MINLTDGFRALAKVISGERWEYYSETVEYADELETIVTGEDADKLLKKFAQREDDALFNQRKEFTQVVTPAISNRIKVPFNKALRNDDIKTVIEPNTAVGEIDSKFYEGKSILKYLEERIKDRIFVDPNAHLVIDFDEFDPNTETATPYPTLFKSEQVLWREETKSGELLYLITEKNGNIYLWTKTSKSKSDKFGDFSIIKASIQPKGQYSGVVRIDKDKTDTLSPVDNEGFVSFMDKTYKIEYINSDTPEIQAKRIGYLFRSEHDYKTCISPIHPAIGRLKKTIKTSSELDLTVALHAFPQKVVAREACNGYTNAEGRHEGCKDGRSWSEADQMDITCPNCKGSGYEPIHTTAADVIYITLADNKEDQIDPTKIAHYITVDTESPRFQNEYLLQLEEQCVKDVFASSAYSIKSQTTATEIQVQYDSVYDVLEPFTEQLSALYGFTASRVATFKDVKVESAELIFPADLRLKSQGELIAELETAQTAPTSTRYDLSAQIIHKTFQNEPIKRQKELVKLDLKPYAVETIEEVTFYFNNGMVSDQDKFLYGNFDKVLREIELNEGDKFYQYERSKQFELIYTKVDELMPSVSFEPVLDGLGS